MKSVKFILFFVALLSVKNAIAVSNDSLLLTQEACKAFQAKLKADPRFITGTAQVPKYWDANPSTETLPVFWWMRKGTDSSYPPIVFLHGGPAANSWALLDKWKTVIDQYPGDFVSFDHRGEGCSKTLASNLPLAAYQIYRIRNIIKDIEFLRQNVFHYSTWRVMGHSRGAAMVHYYLEMAPDAIESAYAMGFSIMPHGQQSQYPMIRAHGYYRTSEAYLEQYPSDAALLQKIRETIENEKMCWPGVDGAQLCGANALDVLGYNYVKNLSAWNGLHSKITAMTDSKSIYDTLAPLFITDTYGHFNYIIATNGQDFGSPDMVTSAMLKKTANPIYVEPALAELRYVNEVIAPQYPVDWTAHVDTLDYYKVLANLTSHPKLKYYLYAGSVDPIAPVNMFLGEVAFLGDKVNFKILTSGHDGWFYSELLNAVMMK